MAQYHSLKNSDIDGVRPTSIAASNPVIGMSLRELQPTGANGDVQQFSSNNYFGGGVQQQLAGGVPDVNVLQQSGANGDDLEWQQQIPGADNGDEFEQRKLIIRAGQRLLIVGAAAAVASAEGTHVQSLETVTPDHEEPLQEYKVSQN